MLGFAPLLAVAVIALVALALQTQKMRQRRHLLGSAVDVAGDSPTILFFSGVTCTICHTAQRPALDRLESELDGRVRVREIDVAEEPALARRFRVMSLPTTVLLDADGHARTVNVGFASAQLLRDQLAQVGLVAHEVAVA